MVPFIDLHCHLDLVKDPLGAIKRAEEASVRIVTSGIHPQSNRLALEYASAHESVKASIGLYPIDAMQRESGGFIINIDDEVEFMRKSAESIIAIGEIGLDYKTGSKKEEQKELFLRLLNLAIELDKPVIIHSREAERDAIDILAHHEGKAILHCFSGPIELVKRAADIGCFFTVPTSIVRNDHFKELVKAVPISQLFCETDSPFLSPFPGKRNEPAFVIESYKAIAAIKGLDLSETANLVYSNYQRVFG
jgi:TatD DNase family protein